MKKLKEVTKRTIEISMEDFLYLVQLSKIGRKTGEYKSMRVVVGELVQFHKEHTCPTPNI
jgi:hypothetical protein